MWRKSGKSGAWIVNDTRQQLSARLEAVEARISAACRRAGRGRRDVTLVAVTKTVSADTASLLLELGVTDLGENRPQELWRKAGVLPRSVTWHLIGHLQRNKVSRMLPLAAWIHAVVSLRLLEALETEAGRQGIAPRVLLEVNASGEASKHGFQPAEVPGLASRLHQLQHVQVCGLMTMAALLPDPQQCRPTFRTLRDLRDRLQDLAALPLPHLSMGMSNDFEVAIEEGATMVRIGSALFEGVSK